MACSDNDSTESTGPEYHFIESKVFLKRARDVTKWAEQEKMDTFELCIFLDQLVKDLKTYCGISSIQAVNTPPGSA